jgi:hypothetical protein
MSAPLSNSQLEEFGERGWTVLKEAFSPSVAKQVRRELARRVGVDFEDPRCWTQPRIWLQEALTDQPYIDALTERFQLAVDQLAGANRWKLRRYMGWWPITFPGFADPPYGQDWHVDGMFRHFVYSPELAVLNLFCFSTVEPGGGGTLLAEGSHRIAARILWEAEPSGLEPLELSVGIGRALGTSGWPGVVEVTADEGDVVLGHPLLLHSSNPNHGDRVRVMAQPQFDMTEPKRAAGSDLSPVEVVLSRARAER